MKEFQKFLLRGNLVELAIGFTVGAAFSTVARSLVDDIIMPPISAVLGSTDFSDLFVVIKSGNTPPPYETLANAESAGAITWNYGEFLTNIFTLLIIAIAMFLVIRLVNRLEDRLENLIGNEKKEKDSEPINKKCPYCYTTIAYKATRCPNCTSELKPKK